MNGMADQIHEHLLDLDLPALARDGDCIPVSEEIASTLIEHGWEAKVVTVWGWLDQSSSLLGFGHAAVLVNDTWVVDATATQYNSSFPPVIIAEKDEYLSMLAEGSGVQSATIQSTAKTSNLKANRIWWRRHPEGRPFSPETATSGPMTSYPDEVPEVGFSAFRDPWDLWVYLNLMRWGPGDIIGFSGTVVGQGIDGEDLVLPDMEIVMHFTWDQFMEALEDTPRPEKPWGHSPGPWAWWDQQAEWGNVYASRQTASVEWPSSIPSSDRMLLEQRGVQVSQTEERYAPAWYDPSDRTIYYRLDGLGRGINDATLVHEVGHAIDHALGWLSESGAFKAIAKQYNIPKIQGHRGISPWREIWADGYAALYGNETPMWWPGNDSDLARVIRDARNPRDLSVTGDRRIAMPCGASRDLEEALWSWKGWPSDMGIHMADEVAGAPEPSSGSGKQKRAQAAALLQALRDAPLNPVTLYRAGNIGPYASAWSESRKVAQGWSNRGGTPVQEMAPGTAPSIRIADFISSGLDADERE